MPTASGPTVFRITGLPDSSTEQAESLLIAVIKEQLSEEEKQTLKIEITIIPSCNSSNNNGQKLVALVDFKRGIPNFLSGLVKNQLREWQVEIDDTGEDISFDCHFHGFTQLYNTQPSQTITADIIAITGLGGHAYGSWRGKGNLGRMWLRHFLSKDLPRCRTMIYGYNSKLSSRGIGTVEDYSREFLEGIKKVRGTKETRERPLFFVAHSFGGIILARCLVRAAQTNEDDHPTIATLYKATYGILFFAVPHRGLIVNDMESMLDQDNHPRKALLEQINKGSDLLVPDFKDLIRDRKIVTFYETEQTRRLEQNSEDGSWARTGPFITALDTDSAILQLPINMEIKIPIHADHSTIVKFDNKNAPGYEHALEHLKDFEWDALDVIKARFGKELSSIEGAYKQPDEDLLKSLPSAAQAAFNSYDKQHDPLCLDETRVDILEQIMAWGDGDDERCIFWLSGMAGTGKSTIARTVARKYYDRNRLGASFFFSRGREDVSHASKFFTSIAVQLANKSPALKRHICKAITECSSIASQVLRDQWNQLVLGPLSKLEADSLQSPLILVVDALDECDGKDDIRVILQLLGEARKLRAIRLRIFMTSRPEIPIRHGFYQLLETRHHGFVLHNISPPIIDHDISIFFEHNLGIIKQKLALAADWPGKQTIKCLVRSANGLFIWAATACRFIGNGEQFAEKRLSLILKGGPTVKGPEGKLNEIYVAILTNSVSDEYDDKEKEELYKMLKEALGTIVILFSSLSAISLARLLHIPMGNLYRTLDDLHSVLEVPKDDGQPVRLHHPSFRDFLLDKQRCHDERFWVDEKKAHEALAESCLRLMSKNLKRDICDLHSLGTLTSEVDSCRVEQYLPADLQYACRYWVQHLLRAQLDLCNHRQVSEFFQKHFLHWLEALSLIGKISEGGHMVTELSRHLFTLQVSDIV
ncbi:hypothetical protein GP486_007289 [Trichoglossum hirsutum]|uniref:Nephrocystin 3-like N-terminal domain-containing protein n=1 Tax=Trichoglossum hirsutum TaxID=265104 RepID=A0A9P8IHP9_9PEZI|nr:hypothetical protein GP486_007289 [Trichoglossum hirsutum]